jgi:tetratricopeptide (TPR) repeat protein
MRFVLQAVGGLLFGVAIVAGLELGLRVLGIAEGAPRHDPFAGFSSAVPAFEPAVRADGTRIFQLSPARRQNQRLRHLSEPQREFLADKPDGAFRIFVVGGSSAEGIPYSTRYAFSTWLERRLSASLPEVRIEVVNAAFSGYSSRRLLPVVEEITRYEPDLLVIYMGHNEWAERMYYEHLLRLDPRLFRVLEWGYQTRIYALASRILDVPAFAPPSPLELDPDANTFQMFGVFRGRAEGHDYPTPRELGYRDLLYENNLQAMADAMKRAGARTMFCTLSQNFSDWPPPASRHRDGLAPDELREWERAFGEGRRLAADGDCDAALGPFEQALAIDDRYADLQFRAATCLRSLGRLPEARQRFRLASDLDAVPHGAPTHLNEILRRVAGEEDGLFLDVDRLLDDASGAALVGNDLFTDFAHPNLRAHQLIAAAVSATLREAGLPRPAEQWRNGYVEADLESLYREEPELRIRELESRVFVCLLAPRETCAQEAQQLLVLQPQNEIAARVLRE